MGMAEFEERTFEFPLYYSLADNCLEVWSPGQCLEGHLGFDSGLYTSNSLFWDRLNGNILAGVSGSILPKSVPSAPIKDYPNFNMNLFLQAKRPFEYVHPPRVYKKKYGTPNTTIFRFDATASQQKTLLKLSGALTGSALVAYACPRFSKNLELYRHIKNNTVIDNTFFIKASDVDTHKQVFFPRSDCDKTMLHSEPETYEGEFDLLDELFELTEPADNQAAYHTMLNSLAQVVIRIMKEADYDPVRQATFFDHLAFLSNDRYAQAILDFFAVRLFSDLHDLLWCVLAPAWMKE